MNIDSTCGKCGQAIEFDESQAGRMIECPHCHRATTATIPRPDIAPAISKSAEGTRRLNAGIFGVLFITSVGIALIVVGCAGEDKNGINQVYSAIQYCTGWLLIAAALVLDALRHSRRA